MFFLKRIFRVFNRLQNDDARTILRYFFITVLIYLGGSTVMWCVEGKTDQFKCFGDCLWYSIVTMTTVGYGDIYPKTFWGRITGASLMILGIAMLGSLLGTLASYLIERKRKEDLGLKSYSHLENHTVICNFEATDREMLTEIRNELPREEVIILSSTLKEKPDYFDERTYFVSGRPTSTEDLLKCGIEHARNVVVFNNKQNTSHRDAETILAVLGIDKINPKSYICAEMEELENYAHLKNAGADTVISWNGLRNKIFAQEVVDQGVTAIITDLLSTVVGDQQIRKIVIDSALLAQASTFGALVTHLKISKNMIAIGIEKCGAASAEKCDDIIVNPDSTYRLTEGESVFCIAR